MSPKPTARTAPKQPTTKVIAGQECAYTESFRLGCHDVKAGDRLRVTPSAPRKRDGIAAATFRYAWVLASGEPVEITVAGSTGPKRPTMIRTYHPDRIEWMRQPKEKKA